MTAEATAVVANGAEYFAILIGINAYGAKPLKGCVNDIQQIKKYLDALPFHVTVQNLTAAGPSDEASSLDCNALRPTYDEVKAAFQQTTSVAKVGDCVYIHFSGHGTRVSASEEFSNEATGDLALVLLENEDEGEHGAGGEEQYLRGVELASWLKAMVDKGVVVTLVLDCCFSAAVYRYDDLSVRYLPYNAVVAAKHPPALSHQALSSSSSSSSASLLATRDASMLPNWLISPEKYAIIVACGPDQDAKELRFPDGQIKGVLSHFLVETWRRHGGLGSRHKTIYRRLCAETNRWTFRQHPILYGNGEQTFFGFNDIGNEAARIALVKRKDAHFEMPAGRAHGIHADDQIVITSAGRTYASTDADNGPLTARIIDIRGLTSDVEILNVENHLYQTQYILEAEIWSSFRQHRIKVDTSLPHHEELVKRLQARTFNATIDSKEQDFSLLVASDRDQNLRITSCRGPNLINLSDIKQKEMDIKGICATVEHLIKYQMIQQLSNEAPSNTFGESFDAKITHPRGMSCSGDVITVQDGEICELKIENKSQDDIYIFAYGMGPEWQVCSLLKATYEVVPPRDILNGLKGFFKKKLKMSLSPGLIERGHRECRDIVKVIVTKTPTSFDLLELPKLGKAVNKTSDKTCRRQSSGGADDWMACTFEIRTCCRSETIG